MPKYTFSGHESFQCKSLWLKKGYDFMQQEKDFNDAMAVVDLGVGKNMVAAIRFWLKAFGLRDEQGLTEIAKYIFDNEEGKDPFVEDVATLWLLHYLLVKTGVASIYQLFFIDFHREKTEFSKEQLAGFIKRKCAETENPNLYNENTINRDVDVLYKNYVAPSGSKPNEDLMSLMTGLNLLRSIDKNTHTFNTLGKQKFVPEILLYAILDGKGEDKAVPFEFLYNLALLFCLTQSELLDTIAVLEKKYAKDLKFTDDGGIKQILFLRDLSKQEVLDKYYK